MSVHTVTINGIDLVYEKEGSGPPLVFIHGGTASAVYWEAIVPHFLADFTCISLEQRGHGRSGRAPSGDYSIPALVEECIGFLASEVGPAVVVGWSQGGAGAMGAAAERPDLVKALYLEDSVPAIYGVRRVQGPPAPPILRWFDAVGTAAAAKEALGLTVAQHAYNIGQLSPFGRKVVETMSPDQLISFARFAYHTDAAWYPFIRNPQFPWPDAICDALPSKVKCPVHVAFGDPASGGLVTLGDLDVLKAAGVNLSATHFPGAGHSISRNFAREFIVDLKAFLARVG